MDRNQMNPQEPVVCSCCGRPIAAYPCEHPEEYLHIQQRWGYFSRKDGELHRFYVCEACYDQWVAGFAVAPTVETASELL